MVNSWLYCSLDRNCRPGTVNSARMNNAIKPANAKNAKQAIMYITPMSL